jgi:predicted transcriptional regulator
MKQLDKPPIPSVGPRRTKTEREADRAEAARLDRKGYTVTAIAKMIGVSKQQISYDLKRIRERHLKSCLEERAAKVAEKLEELRDIRVEAWQAWEQSLGNIADELAERILAQIRAKVERCGKLKDQINSALLDGIKVEVTGKPNTECLRIILACIRQERELLALDSVGTMDAAPLKLDWDALFRDVQNHNPERIDSPTAAPP